jgi:hypothetical protein
MARPERYEQLIAFIGSQLPRPVDQQPGAGDSLIFTGGDPAQVVVHLTSSAVAVLEFAGAWESPGIFVTRPRRVGLLNWRRLQESALMDALSALIRGACEARLTKYRTCRYCGRTTPPEWLREDDACLTCTASQDEVVH